MLPAAKGVLIRLERYVDLQMYFLSMFQMKSIYDKYYSYETTTSIKLKYSKLPFPSVTVCNINPLRKSMLEKYANEELVRLYEDVIHSKFTVSA